MVECGGRGWSFSPWDQGKEPEFGRVPCEVISSSLMPLGSQPQTKQALPRGDFWGWVLFPGSSLSSSLHLSQASAARSLTQISLFTIGTALFGRGHPALASGWSLASCWGTSDSSGVNLDCFSP